jgi:hypothetical protein
MDGGGNAGYRAPAGRTGEGGKVTIAKNLFRATKAKPLPVESFPDLDLPLQKAPEETRRAHDFYTTYQPEPIRALLHRDGDVIRACGGVWEPACGAGDMVREIRDFGLPCTASDLIMRGCPDGWQADYFTCVKSRARAIITNPPYNLINARDGGGAWLKHTLDMPGWDYLALLLSWDWPAAVANGLGKLLDERPFSHSYLLRWKVDFTGAGSPPQRNAWFVWRRGWTGPSEFRFLDKRDHRQAALPLEGLPSGPTQG